MVAKRAGEKKRKHAGRLHVTKINEIENTRINEIMH